MLRRRLLRASLQRLQDKRAAIVGNLKSELLREGNWRRGSAFIDSSLCERLSYVTKKNPKDFVT